MKARDIALGVIGAYAAFRFTYRMKHRIRFAGRTVLISGGSRGLGLVIARKLAREGAKLVLIARDRDRLERARAQIEELGAEVLAIAADNNERSEIDRAVDQAIARFGKIDVLINCAGIIQVGPIEHMSLGDFERALSTHLWGPLNLIAAVLPGMRAQKFGRIVNVSSIGGQVAVPHMAPYAASKFALVGLSEALRSELMKYNVMVSTVCPMLMRTGSPRNALFKGRRREEYAWFKVSDSLPGLSISAETAASRIICACRYGIASTFLSPLGRAIAVLARLAPELTADVLALANRLLPSFDPTSNTISEPGHRLETPVTKSFVTALTKKAAMKNNEM